MATTDYSLAHSLPANVEAERSILGAILLDNFAYNQAAEHLKPEDFSLDSHRRIYTRMMDLAESSRPIDMITLVEEFDRHKELEAIGDVGYISGLVDGVPDRPSIEHYIKIVRDKALLRGLIHAANSAIARAADQSDPAEEVLNDAEAAIMQLSEKRIGRGFMGVQEIVKESFGSVDALLQRGQRITGLATHYTDLDEMTSGLQRSDLIIIAARPSMGKTAFAMNIAENASIEDQKVVGMFSLEMSREALLLRLLCSKARVDSHKMRTGSLWRDDMDKVVHAMDQLAHAPIFIDDTPGISLSEMRAKARRLQQSQGQARSDYRGLPAAHVGRRQALRKPYPGSVRHFARTEGPGQGTESAGGGAFPVEPGAGKPGRRPPPATCGFARIGVDRAGRRRGRVHLPRRGLQTRRTRTGRSRRDHHRQAAQRPYRPDQAGFRQAVHPL